MLTVCIPIYHYDVRGLVTQLRGGGAGAGEVRILAYDDGSAASFRARNREIVRLPNVTYRELPENIGRAAIRNRMARDAETDYLLLLDADGAPNDQLLERYLRKIEKYPGHVIVGGRSYADSAPAAPPLYLHWHYGRQRESAPATDRNHHPYLGFQSNNFVVPRDVLLAHPLPEEVTGYGHEDTLWGQLIGRAGVPLLHVDNPVMHLGLEPVEEFLRKQQRAVENLARIKAAHPFVRTRLTETGGSMPGAMGRAIPARKLYDYLIESRHPSLHALDMLKLRWYLDARKTKRAR